MRGRPQLFLLLVSSPSLTRCLSTTSANNNHQAAKFPVYFDSSNELHRDLRYHPEQPARISKCVEALRRELPQRVELIDVAAADHDVASVEGFRETDDDVTRRPFSNDELEHARACLLGIHAEELVTRLEKRCRQSKERRLEEGKPALGHMGYIDSGDTYVTTESFDVSLRATAAWIRAVETATAGNTDDDGDDGSATAGLPFAFALTRPPGHHATGKDANGFCLYNFAAAAAYHALERNPDLRVSILDWDVHYGQGVADIIQHHPRARYVSIHQTPAFPYLGEAREIQGEHKNVLTIPMPPATTWDSGYKELFEKALDFVFEAGTWEADLVIVSAGYDAMCHDELASVNLNAVDYGKMVGMLWERLSAARGGTTKRKPTLVLGLEGGYQLNQMGPSGNLPDAVVETIKALLEQQYG